MLGVIGIPDDFFEVLLTVLLFHGYVGVLLLTIVALPDLSEYSEVTIGFPA